MTKEQVEALIDKLADKTLSFGCKVKSIMGIETITHRHTIGNVKECWGTTNGRQGSLLNDDEIQKVFGHPVYIGDVLEKIDEIQPIIKGDEPSPIFNLLTLWRPYGFNESLQEIFEEAISKKWVEDPNVRALFEFLATIFNK